MMFSDEDYRGKVLIEPAAAPVNYRLWVGGARVTSANKDGIGVASGTATFNPETQTLRLTDATIAAGGYDDGISNGLEDLEGMPAFKIVCNGTNSIDAVNSDGAGLALFGNTTITGSRLGISAYDKGIYVGDLGELNLQDADVYVEGSHPVYCGYNTFVYVRHSWLEADPGTSQNSPVVGAREFNLVDSEYQDPGIGIDPDQLYYNERAEMMYYDGDIYYGPIWIVPVGPGTTTGVDEASLRRGNGEKADGGGDYYTLDGRKLSGKPGKSGVYIQNGRKVVVR